jgi:hypothetical protein
MLKNQGVGPTPRQMRAAIFAAQGRSFRAGAAMNGPRRVGD